MRSPILIRFPCYSKSFVTTFEEESLGNQAKRDYDFTAAADKLGFRGRQWWITGGRDSIYIYIYICACMYMYVCVHMYVYALSCVYVCFMCIYIYIMYIVAGQGGILGSCGENPSRERRLQLAPRRNRQSYLQQIFLALCVLRAQSKRCSKSNHPNPESCFAQCCVVATHMNFEAIS